MPRFPSLLLTLALLLPASARGDQSPKPPHESDMQEASPEQREKLLKRIRLVRMYALTEALDLDEATAAKLFPFLKGQDAKRKAHQDTKKEHTKALRKMLRSETFPAKEVDEHIGALAQLKIEMAQSQAEETEGLKAILSPAQRAKYVMVREKLEQEIRRTIREHRRERRDERGKKRKRR
jgi:CRISPR/Cas system CSM-associated protein Csm4 (group 5 of RAMP superfamily)